MKALVIYHRQCQDGFASACVVAFAESTQGREVEFLPAKYGDAPPSVTGRRVFVVDFSYPVDVMLALAAQSAGLVWIDHHETTKDYAAQLAGQPGVVLAAWSAEHCGATLTWRELVGGIEPEVPAPLRYVEDRDLWRWALPRSREMSAGFVALWGPTWDDPSSCWAKFVTDGRLSEAEHVGSFLLVAQAERVRLARRRAEGVTLSGAPEGARVLAVNASSDVSEIGEALCIEDGADIAVVYFRGEDGRWVHSLRSRGGVDVSAIAAVHGGGGHKAAAGFAADMPVVLW